MPPASGNSDVSPLMAQMMQEKFPPNGTRWTDDLRVKDDKDLTSSARDRKYPNANRQWSDEDVSIAARTDRFLDKLLTNTQTERSPVAVSRDDKKFSICSSR